MNSRHILLAFFAGTFCFWASLTGAAALEKTQQTLAKAQQQAAVKQQQIDSLDSKIISDHQQYLDALRQADLLDAYNQQLEKLITAQQKELVSTEEQLASLQQTELTVLPLLEQMQAGLHRFVEADLPFLQSEREQRLQRLDSLLVRADISLAEKYRQLLNAYQTEVEYGRTLEAYSGELLAGDDSREVNFIRLGRTALYYQTRDGQESGIWNATTGTWDSLPGSHNSAIHKAIQLAKQQVVPDLLTLPLPVITQETQP